MKETFENIDEVRAVPHVRANMALAHDLHLTSGETLSEVHVTYETWGTLNEACDNAIYICHALTGDSHVASTVDDGNGGKYVGENPDGAPAGISEGWWNKIVGPGRAIDTNRYYVICSNVLGGCSGTTGPLSTRRKGSKLQRHDSTTTRYGLDFPVLTIEDMVACEKTFCDQLGVTHLKAVVGGSLGGMRALDWARMYPDCVDACVGVCTTWMTSPQNIAFDEVGRRAIRHDAEFKGGNYTDADVPGDGLSIARMIAHITYLSNESMDHKFGRRFINDQQDLTFSKDFEVEGYLEHQGKKFIDRFDANSYLYITRAMDYFSLGETLPAVTEAFHETPVRFLLLSYTSDWLFPTYQMKELLSALVAAGAEVSFAEIEAPYGHDSFLIEYEWQNAYVKTFLEALQ